MTPADIQTGVAVLQAAFPDFVKALGEKFANVDDDVVVVEDIVKALVSAGVLPFYANWLASGLAFAIENNQSATASQTLYYDPKHTGRSMYTR